MKNEDHLRNLKESVQEIEKAIIEGISEKQRTIGFNASTGAIDMLEIILHKSKVLDTSAMMKHEWFNSERRIAEKLKENFPRKDEIIPLIKKIQSVRNIFCYGKKQPLSSIRETVENFNTLKKIFMEVTNYGI